MKLKVLAGTPDALKGACPVWGGLEGDRRNRYGAFILLHIEAVFDGTVFRPTESVALAPNTRVRVTIESVLPAESEAPSFLRTARALRLDGPPDWAANIDEYLYGGDPSHAG